MVDEEQKVNAGVIAKVGSSNFNLIFSILPYGSYICQLKSDLKYLKSENLLPKRFYSH